MRVRVGIINSLTNFPFDGGKELLQTRNHVLRLNECELKKKWKEGERLTPTTTRVMSKVKLVTQHEAIKFQLRDIDYLAFPRSHFNDFPIVFHCRTHRRGDLINLSIISVLTSVLGDNFGHGSLLSWIHFSICCDGATMTLWLNLIQWYSMTYLFNSSNTNHRFKAVLHKAVRYFSLSCTPFSHVIIGQQ